MERKMRNRTKGAKRTFDERYGEEHLSGAYIRSLVKQLTASSKPKQEDESSSGICDTSSAKFGGVFGDAPQSQQVKKQVRRRAHTSKPYQERLLNMAEARKEIVTALKYHRAAMRQAQSEGNQREPQENRIVSPGTANFTFPDIGLPPSHLSPWVPPSIDSVGLPALNVATETLALNLNFHHFGTPSMGFFERGSDARFNNNPITVPNCSSPSSTSLLGNQNCIGVAPTATVPCLADPSNAFISPVPMSSDSVCHHAGAALHSVLDEEEMAEIRSLGEQHQMEWNDTMNLVSSAWWFNFVNNLEVSEEGTSGKVDGPIFDEFMEIPSRWNFGVDNLDVATIASPDDEYEDFLQDMSFEW